MLLDSNPPPNLCSQDEDGDITLHYTVIANDETVVRMLIRYGAETIIRNDSNKTTLDSAIEHEYDGIITALKEKP